MAAEPTLIELQTFTLGDELTPKFSKSNAGYRDTSLVYPCRTCRWFGVKDEQERREAVNPSTCDIITTTGEDTKEPDILPGGTCILWRRFRTPIPVLKELPSPSDPPLWWNFRILRSLAVTLYGRLPIPDMRGSR